MNLNLLNFAYDPNPPIAIQQIVDRYNNGYSVVVLICADMRGGKSKKGFIIANWLSELIFKKAWDYKRGTIVGVDNLIEKLGNGIFVMDEVQLQLSRKKTMTKISDFFFDVMTSQAYHHFILLLICPSANTLGRDHANNVNFVFPIDKRITVLPYKVNSNRWNITADPKDIPIEGLGSWNLDIDDPIIKYVFKDELTHIDEYIENINVCIKQKNMQLLKERVGVAGYRKDKTTGEVYFTKRANPMTSDGTFSK